MEEANDNLCIATLFNLKDKKKKKKKKTKANKKGKSVAVDSATAPNDDGSGSSTRSDANPRISLFDLSVENFFEYIDTVAKLCGEEERNAAVEESEIKRTFSSVIFLREWSDFKYPSKSIRFAYGLESSECYEGNGIKDINLPQFSSATVPKHDMQKEELLGDAKSQESRDFVMNVGGSVWALDWCPRMHEEPDCSITCEFIAVAAHPPGSSYHKMGASLIGRGAVQIWCLLNNTRGPNEEVSCFPGKKEKKPKKDTGTNDKSTEIKRPRGRPRKNPTGIAVDDTQSLTAQENPENNEEIVPITNKRKRGRPKKYPTEDNEEIVPITNKSKRGRPIKNLTVIAVDDTNCETVQFEENSMEFPAPNGNNENNEKICHITYKRKKVPRGNEAMNEKPALIKRPIRRPKKNSKEVTANDPNCEKQFVPLAVQLPDSAEFISPNIVHGNSDEHHSQQLSTTKGKKSNKAAPACNSETLVTGSRLDINHGETSYTQDTSRPLLIQCENEANHQPHSSSVLEPQESTCPIPRHVALPRVVSCLAHNGKVAWDVKWRPLNNLDSSCKHRMGYLAVLLGNGSLEVWDVPLPHALRAIYMHREGTDPRFIKLEPVFKCSMLKRSSSQSIPLTVEWSTMPPHDYLLAGCHDGTVALWKFSPNSSSKCDDTKPILCFGGDTVPIRTIAWAPFEGNPFRPLRILQPSQRIIYSLDWLPNPSCIIMSFEDGTMKTISLVKAASDLPVTGTIYTGKKQPWLHGSTYSSYAIWSVQVSRITGMVAYCGADGAAIRYQLITKAVENEHWHNRLPFALCGSVSEEESTIIVNTPLSNSLFPMKKAQERGRCAESFRDLLAKSRIVPNQISKTPSNDCQILALNDGDTLGLESISEEALSSQEQPKRPKLSCSRKKKQFDNTVCSDVVSTNTPGVDKEKPDSGSIHEPEVFPPKMAALHKVRWNMNKGSERWLCFGGANGLLRCQKIVYSDTDKKWALKR
ncbi:hypothetical protein TSUD_25480 [Trifolium subterraneum]|uniref:Uncharacterized protein n=1 Tax=Trifolium subterraneum TaxID=3900 RepID=A0A2Z6NES6_TRISU|nr:hypothetical protein TSUD_25480 [Trifolium subterraneum]